MRDGKPGVGYLGPAGKAGARNRKAAGSAKAVSAHPAVLHDLPEVVLRGLRAAVDDGVNRR